MATPPLPELMEEVVEEVLLRFPADEPSSLVRASLVCRLWHRLVSAATFRRRFREFHRRPPAPVLGVIYDNGWETCFVSTSSFSPARDDVLDGRRVIDAHHGRVLLHHDREPSRTGAGRIDLSVWDPITDEQQELPSLPLHMSMNPRSWNAAVVCAAAATGGSCDHLDCHRGPFLVVFIGIVHDDDTMFACVYASDQQACTWSKVASSTAHHNLCDYFELTPGVVAMGNTLHFLARDSFGIVNYDMAAREISVLELPWKFRYQNTVLITTEDGRLGLATMGGKYKLFLWSREVDSNRDAGLVLSRVIDLEKLLPAKALRASTHVSGFADGAGVLFTHAFDGLYSVNMESEQVRKVPHCYGFDVVVPYVSFHTQALGAASTADGPASY